MGVNENSLFYFYFGEKFVTCCFFHFMLYTFTFFSQFLCPLNFKLNSFKTHYFWYNVKLHNGYKNWLYSVSTECLWGKSVSLMYIIFIILRNFHSLYTFSWFWVVWISKFQIFYEPLWMSIWVMSILLYICPRPLCV